MHIGCIFLWYAINSRRLYFTYCFPLNITDNWFCIILLLTLDNVNVWVLATKLLTLKVLIVYIMDRSLPLKMICYCHNNSWIRLCLCSARLRSTGCHVCGNLNMCCQQVIDCHLVHKLCKINTNNMVKQCFFHHFFTKYY